MKKLERAGAENRLEKENSAVLCSILIDLAAISPNVFPASFSCISLILTKIGILEKRMIFEKVANRASRIPNNGYLEVWLQRVAEPNNFGFLSTEPLCKHISPQDNSLWNVDWVGDDELATSIQEFGLVDLTKLYDMKKYIERSEFDSFWNNDNPS